MEYTLVLKADMLAVIDRALGQCPYAAVAPTIAELQRQVNEQNAAREMADKMNGKPANKEAA